MKKLLFFGLLILAPYSQAMFVTPTSDGQLMADYLKGDGITIDYSSINYVGAAEQSGIFTGSGTTPDYYNRKQHDIGFTRGVLLTTGNAVDANGPNDISLNPGTSHLAGTDTDLTNLTGINHYDATSLSFDFATTTGEIFLNYIFASEEYSGLLFDNDAMAIFIDGVNYGLTPDGNLMSVHNIHCGIWGMVPETPNCESHRINAGPIYYDLQYAGLSDVFTLNVSGLSEGTHNIKIVIADTRDRNTDSGVLLQAGSLSATGAITTVPVLNTFFLLGLGLFGFIIYGKNSSQITRNEAGYQ